MILGGRLLLLLAVLGSFVLGLLAMQRETYPALAVLVAYCCLTVLPLVWSSVRPR